VSFDLEHDEHLYKLLLEESRSGASGFEVLGRSERLTDAGLWSGRVRQQIREADQVIVICGAHTGNSPSVAAELRIAREEGKPQLLLWGHRDRETMCTKPIGAKSDEGMYSWTPEVLQERFAYLRRTDRTREGLREKSRAVADEAPAEFSAQPSRLGCTTIGSGSPARNSRASAPDQRVSAGLSAEAQRTNR
jgi:hypothetical protein